MPNSHNWTLVPRNVRLAQYLCMLITLLPITIRIATYCFLSYYWPVVFAVPDLKVPVAQPAQRSKQQVEEEADFKALEEELAFN